MAKYKRGGISHLKLASILFVVISLPLIVLAVKTQTNTQSEAASGNFVVKAYTFYDTDASRGWSSGEKCRQGNIDWFQDGVKIHQSTTDGSDCEPWMKFKATKGKCTTITYAPPSGYKETGYSYAYESNWGKTYTKTGKKLTICDDSFAAFGFKSNQQPINY